MRAVRIELTRIAPADLKTAAFSGNPNYSKYNYKFVYSSISRDLNHSAKLAFVDFSTIYTLAAALSPFTPSLPDAG
jgi:hypothetical protein